ncbi:glucose 1-dehydrogenase [Rhabdothermincola salaria]|uniref:glucose 1-dehydrogenase n=1 Tax=Rhabdothermincola salaria TaxID=2903142 RepID=UPI001E491BBA|nr:glucose 1-dehydrogenase [Rhabdothermincola salaria]MCD9625618.1 glucose 1-dehydrogenase [Rhabdothermincola salaria]
MTSTDSPTHRPGRLDGKVALITGAARGQGEAEARLFAAEGAQVVLADVLDAEGEAVAADIGERARYVHLDVSQEDDWAAAIAATEEVGPLSVLVNNAAILRFTSIADTTLEEYLQVIMVNQVGTFLGMRSAIEPMTRSGGGSIVNISSIDGIGSKNSLVAYSSSKGAIRSMTKTAALELGQHRIRVNSVHPGGVFTPMNGDISKKMLDAAHSQLALQRSAMPEEIAAMVLFLASDEASYCTGGEFVVDGGWLAGDINPFLPGAPPAPARA